MRWARTRGAERRSPAVIRSAPEFVCRFISDKNRHDALLPNTSRLRRFDANESTRQLLRGIRRQSPRVLRRRSLEFPLRPAQTPTKSRTQQTLIPSTFPECARHTGMSEPQSECVRHAGMSKPRTLQAKRKAFRKPHGPQTHAAGRFASLDCGKHQAQMEQPMVGGGRFTSDARFRPACA